MLCSYVVKTNQRSSWHLVVVVVVVDVYGLLRCVLFSVMAVSEAFEAIS